MITKSIQATICIIKNTPNSSHSEVLRMLYASKLSLPYHKNFGIIKKTIGFLQNMNRYILFVNYMNLKILSLLKQVNYCVIIYLMFKVFSK